MNRGTVFARVCLLLAIGSLAACGGGGGIGTLDMKASRLEVEEQVASVTFNIASISMSETSESWTVVGENLGPITISSDGFLGLEKRDLAQGEYHGVKVELAPGITYNLENGSTIDQDYPDILMYKPAGIYQYSTAENGYYDTNQYWLFSTRNGALTAPVEVEADETSFLVLSFRPWHDLGADGVGLAATCRYTSFLE